MNADDFDLLQDVANSRLSELREELGEDLLTLAMAVRNLLTTIRVVSSHSEDLAYAAVDALAYITSRVESVSFADMVRASDRVESVMNDLHGAVTQPAAKAATILDKYR